MKWRRFIGLRNKSADLAKNRLQVIIAQQRDANNNGLDYLPMMQQEIMAVIAKYTRSNIKDVKIDLQHRKDGSVIELSVPLPDVDLCE